MSREQNPPADQLTPGGRSVLRDWEKDRPRAVAALRRQGQLVQAVNEAHEREMDLYAVQVRRGVLLQVATFQARQEARYLPDLPEPGQP